jgi:hypothetical protein
VRALRPATFIFDGLRHGVSGPGVGQGKLARMRQFRHAIALTFLAALALASVAEARNLSAVELARGELRVYKRDHVWVSSASLRRCSRDDGQLRCSARIKGRRKGAQVTCAAKVLVFSSAHRRRARLRLGRCRASRTETAPLEFHVQLGSTPARDPSDPFEVTYTYSASATHGAQAGGSAGDAAPLPSGALTLYSDGRLECAVNVGGAVTASRCPVRYSNLGEHRVTVTYTSGEQSTSTTEIENIEPLHTETVLELGYADLLGGPEALDVGKRCTFFENKIGRAHV